jgi:hypothetical protein
MSPRHQRLFRIIFVKGEKISLHVPRLFLSFHFVLSLLHSPQNLDGPWSCQRYSPVLIADISGFTKLASTLHIEELKYHIKYDLLLFHSSFSSLSINFPPVITSLFSWEKLKSTLVMSSNSVVIQFWLSGQSHPILQRNSRRLQLPLLSIAPLISSPTVAITPTPSKERRIRVSLLSIFIVDCPVV